MLCVIFYLADSTAVSVDKEWPFLWQVVNSEGTWVQLDKNSVVEFCESDEGEAWSLARDRGGNQYLRHDDGKPFRLAGAKLWTLDGRRDDLVYILLLQNKRSSTGRRPHRQAPSLCRRSTEPPHPTERRALTTASPTTKVTPTQCWVGWSYCTYDIAVKFQCLAMADSVYRV